MSLPNGAYERLLALRSGLRRFQRWSEQQARVAGLTPAQHQLLLAIRGHPDRRGPTIGEVADYLLLRHHSTGELVDRADVAGLVIRVRDTSDHRIIRLQLTKEGNERLEALSALHLEELKRLATHLPSTWDDLVPNQPVHGLPATRRVRSIAQGANVAVTVVKIDAATAKVGGERVLVDRLWPRGIAKDAAPFDSWRKDVAPSTELRQWFGHNPERFDEFAQRFRDELASDSKVEVLEALHMLAQRGGVVLVTATRDLDHSAAEVLREVLTSM